MSQIRKQQQQQTNKQQQQKNQKQKKQQQTNKQNKTKQTNKLLNPYKPSVPFLGHRQIEQTQIRRRRPDQTSQNAASDQGLHCLLTGISIRNRIKMKTYTRHPYNRKWTLPIDKDGRVH